MKIRSNRAATWILIAALFAAAARSAAQEPDPNLPETIELTVRPAPEPRPALRYRLIPAASERTPGNAAQFYYRAMVQLQTLPKDHWLDYNEHEKTWLSSDRQSFPKDDVAKWLAAHRAVFIHLKVAAYREYCDWDYRVQDLRGMDTINFLLPDAQETRQLARLIRLQAHYDIMDGHYDDAFRSLRLGYQLAQDVGRTPLIINELIGVAIASIMNQELLTLIDHSGANYYWAVASLPQPLIDLRQGLQYEMNMPYQLFPFLKDAETAQRTPDEWRDLLVRCVSGLTGLEGGSTSLSGWQAELLATAALMRLYPVAKVRLIAGGMDPERVEAMPVGQVVAIHTAHVTEYAYHELFKLTYLPYDEATQRLPVLMQSLKKDVLRPDATLTGQSGLPIAALLMPALEGVMLAETRLARSFAAIEAIEALRMHAAANNGMLPASLDQVTIVPVPKNPATGQPFSYHYDAASSRATLDVLATAGQQPRHEGKRYVLRLEK